MGEQRAKKVSEEEALKEAEETLKKVSDAKSDAIGKKVEKETKKSAKKQIKEKYRSIKYKKALLEVDRSKRYPLDEAIELAKKTSYSKFPGSLEVHVKLEKTKKGESVRGIIQLPHGNGKEINAAVIDDEIIEKILKDKNTKYDILIATPQMMPKIAKIAKILGPLGKMPNPKSGTVTTEPEKAIEEIKKGKVEYKADKQGIIHLTLGKINWDDNKLKENFQTLLNQLTGQKLNSVVLCATMGPGIKVNL